MNTFPKVLVVAGESIRPDGNTGRTLYNLFRGWPKERLAQVHIEPVPPDPQVCGTAWHLSLDDVPLDRFLRRVLRLFGAREVHGPQRLAVWTGAGDQSDQPRSVRLSTALKLTVRAYLDCAGFHLSERFWSWARQFSPEVIYCLPGRIRPIRVQHRMAIELGLAVVPHFMDDWPSQLYRGSVLKMPPRRAVLRCLRGLLAHAPFGLAISPAMAGEYGQRYGLPFHPVMNVVDVPERWEPGRRRGQRKFSLAFVGGLHLNRFERMLAAAGVVSKLRREGLEVEIVCYDLRASEAEKRALTESGGVRLAGALSDADALARLREADALLHLEPFVPWAAEFLRLSLSTKLAIYLATGRPILAWSPPALASVQYLQAHTAALVIRDEAPVAFEQGLRTLVRQAELCDQLGQNAWRLAKANHDAGPERERFCQMLARAAWEK